jgi:hypothetical protein
MELNLEEQLAALKRAEGRELQDSSRHKPAGA